MLASRAGAKQSVARVPQGRFGMLLARSCVPPHKAQQGDAAGQCCPPCRAAQQHSEQASRQAAGQAAMQHLSEHMHTQKTLLKSNSTLQPAPACGNVLRVRIQRPHSLVVQVGGEVQFTVQAPAAENEC